MSQPPADSQREPAREDQAQSRLMDLLDAALRLDEPAERKWLAGLRERHPREAPRQLAKRAAKHLGRWAAGWGVATGIPSGPWSAPVSGLADSAALFRLQVKLAARIALIYDPDFLQADEAPYELLIPIFGKEVVDDILGTLQAPKLGNVSRTALRQYLRRSSQPQLRSIILRSLTKGLAARVLGRTVPVINGVFVARWYYAELQKVAGRVCDYFEARD